MASWFSVRQHGPDGAMVTADERAEYMPIYFMEPPHPLVLGFDCQSDRERRSLADKARMRGFLHFSFLFLPRPGPPGRGSG
jgi:CHASE1-domain containing sensor protein